MSPTSPIASPAVRELFYDPLSYAYDEGSWGAPIGGHSDHVHVSFGNAGAALQMIAKGRELGLRVSENPFVDKVDPVHTGSSYHYRTFPGTYGGRRLGMAIDVSGSADRMAAFARWVRSTYIDSSPPPTTTNDLLVDATTTPSSSSSTLAMQGSGCGAILAAVVASWSALGLGLWWWVG